MEQTTEQQLEDLQEQVRILTLLVEDLYKIPYRSPLEPSLLEQLLYRVVLDKKENNNNA